MTRLAMDVAHELGDLGAIGHRRPGGVGRGRSVGDGAQRRHDAGLLGVGEGFAGSAAAEPAATR
jgi:hypothetical protein